MYFNTDSDISDTSLYFDKNDFYNSSILFILKDVGLFDFETDNLLREDLISYSAYTDYRNLGLFLLYQGETQTLEESKDSFNNTIYEIKDNLEPFETIELKDNKELAQRENKIVQSNTLTNFDISESKDIPVKHYKYQNNKFIEV